MEYLLPENLSLESFREQLAAFVPLRSGPSTQTRRIFLDSFDWRLFRRQRVLAEVTDDNGTRLHLRKIGIWSPMQQTTAEAPRFAAELPPGPLTDTLAEILEMRCLLPLAQTLTTTHSLAVLNKDLKTVLRLEIEDHRGGPAAGEPERRLSTRVRLIPLQGYRKPLWKMDGYLRKRMGLEPAALDIWYQAMDAAGRRPGDYRSKLDVQLLPDQPAIVATRKILLLLLDTMERNRDGIRRGLDSEFLHDFRVAVRRTRSALGQIKDVLPPTVLARYKPEFAWLGAITGPIRDLDVHLLKFETYRDDLPPQIREDLSPLQDFLHEEQRKAQRTLAGDLASRRYRHLIEEWRRWLGSPMAEIHDLPSDAGHPVIEVASKHIRGIFERALREGNRITDQSPATDLHELRKTCKKLRYLLEFFQSLYPAHKIGSLIKALKVLQENLGDFQDLEVQSRALRDFSRRMSEPAPPPETLLAMGMLIESLQIRQKKVRSDFSVRFSEFTGNRNIHLARDLFGKGKIL
ncbi:MAG: hypothetical protein A2X84_14285 [Desulfuromonadaceae bacterium GWC2_58_13]|nr:MAG: hypothetical protein A2X84_14285 [Desulfuromonadaceae bacterium GWC2_58_13]